MPVHPLPIRGPSCILQVPRHGAAEERGTAFILDANYACHLASIWNRKLSLTDSSALSMASAHSLLSELALRITSVRPCWYLRVWQLSYVTPGRLNILWKASCFTS